MKLISKYLTIFRTLIDIKNDSRVDHKKLISENLAVVINDKCHLKKKNCKLHF